jgi:hypothetical protein
VIQTAIAGEDSSSQSSDSESETESQPQSSLTYELRARLEDISELVNKLIKFSVAIRASGVRNRTLRATAYDHWEDGFNQSEIFETIYLPQVLRQRYGLEDPLLQRLCKTISTRRRRFLYQRHHQENLGYGADALELRRTQRRPLRADSPSRAGSLSSSRNLQENGSGPAMCDVGGGSLLQPPTKATTFNNFALDTANKSSIVSGSKRASGQQISEIPPPPQVGLKQKHFQCPYCCLLVPREKADVSRWRLVALPL